MPQQGRGASFKSKTSTKNDSRESRLSDAFDAFRLDPTGFGEFQALQAWSAAGDDNSLTHWLISVPFNIKINTLCAYMRVIRMGLTAQSWRDGSFERLDVLVNADQIDQKLYYTFKSYDTNSSGTLAALNRLIEKATRKWRSTGSNCNAAETPAWLSNVASLYILVSRPEWAQLQNTIEVVKNMCFQKKGAAASKSKPIHSSGNVLSVWSSYSFPITFQSQNLRLLLRQRQITKIL